VVRHDVIGLTGLPGLAGLFQLGHLRSADQVDAVALHPSDASRKIASTWRRKTYVSIVSIWPKASSSIRELLVLRVDLYMKPTQAEDS
jgi:hypothetical protein